MTTNTPATGELRLALDAIRLRENVRELDNAHVETLAQSIALRGLLVPLIVRSVDEDYELVAGYHRMAACRRLDLTDAPVVVRDKEGSSADSAAENVTRKQLTPLQEAKAVQAMLEGYSLDGAAQAARLESASSRRRGRRSSSCPMSASGSSAPVPSPSARSTRCSPPPTSHRPIVQSVADGSVGGGRMRDATINDEWRIR